MVGISPEQGEILSMQNYHLQRETPSIQEPYSQSFLSDADQRRRIVMRNMIIKEIELKMQNWLNEEQMDKLCQTLEETLKNVSVAAKTDSDQKRDNETILEDFLDAKRIEGCSDKTLQYYRRTIFFMLKNISKNVRYITTEDLRRYLTWYQNTKGTGKITMDNIRRILSSFFAWLEDEDYVIKSPVRRIHKVRTNKVVKEIYSDEMLEMMRDQCIVSRDLAMIDLLTSTGMRVGELVSLNREDINFHERECVVFGKGNKERIVYFDARTKLHLWNYLHQRKDQNPALFVSLRSPYERLEIGGVETRLRNLGRRLNLKVHPHKFRRTLATMAIDKGMPIEQVQHLLGHQKIDTTLQYAMVKQQNVKISHRRYIG